MSEPGRVIEFIEDRGFLTAMVTRIKGPKLLVLSETDREMNVAESRILHETRPGLDPAQPRLELIRRLKDISRRRAELSRTVYLPELWNLLEGEGEEFTYEYLAELAWPGPRTSDRVAAMIRAVFADGLYFKMRTGLAFRHDPDKVEQILENRARDQARENELEQGGAWLGRVWAGDPSDEPECRDRLVKILRDMAINGDVAPEAKWGQRILERAGLDGDPWRPFHLLVKLGEMHLHQNLEIIRQEVPTTFSPEILAEAEEVARGHRWRDQPRRDLKDLDIITADSGGARDFDDAVSLAVEGDHLVLGVHIADVSAVIVPGSLLDREAMTRATSIYMPDQRIPMLPEVLSEECLSLKEGQPRPAFSLMAGLTPDGEVLDFDFFPSVVQVHRQLSYHDVDESVDHDPTLKRMFELSQGLKNRRTAAGAIFLPLPKLNVFLTPEGEIGVNLTQWENPGRAMISEFMILANALAARFLRDRSAACYYRTQGPPSELLVDPNAPETDLFLWLRQRAFLDRVSWSIEPAPHSGMGLEMYTNLTSPLRRYIDLIIQRQVRSVLNGGPPLYASEEMAQALIQIEAARKTANRLQNGRRRYWLLRYMDGPGRRDYEALVLDRLPHRYRIYLTELMMDADLPLRSGLNLAPGERIKVRIKKADARQDILRFDLA